MFLALSEDFFTHFLIQQSPELYGEGNNTALCLQIHVLYHCITCMDTAQNTLHCFWLLTLGNFWWQFLNPRPKFMAAQKDIENISYELMLSLF